MHLAGPWKEGWEAHFLEDATCSPPCWPRRKEQGRRTQAPGWEAPTFLTEPKVRDLQETLGVQEKIIQLKVSEGKAGQTPKKLRRAKAQGTAAPPHSSPGGGQPLIPLPTPPASRGQVTCK